MNTTKNWYELIGVPTNAPIKEIKKAVEQYAKNQGVEEDDYSHPIYNIEYELEEKISRAIYDAVVKEGANAVALYHAYIEYLYDGDETNPQKGISILTTLISSLHSPIPELYRLRAELYDDDDKTTEALSDIETLFRLDPSNMMGRYKKAEIFAFDDQFHKSTEIVLEILLEDPSFYLGIFRYIELLFNLEEIDKATEFIATVERKISNYTPELKACYYICKAKIHNRLKDYDTVTSLLKEFVLLADDNCSSEDFFSLTEHVKEWVKLSEVKELFPVLEALSDKLYWQTGLWKESAYEVAEEDPELYSYLTVSFRSLFEHGGEEEAFTLLEEALQKEDLSFDQWLDFMAFKIELYCRQSNKDKANELFEMVLERIKETFSESERSTHHIHLEITFHKEVCAEYIERCKKLHEVNGACFIATAVYGDYDHPQVLSLRNFRDSVLQTSVLGRSFIRFYYAVSPPIAKVLKRTTITKYIVRKFLNLFVAVYKRKK